MKPNNIYQMDCREGLKMLADNSIDCCVTSPPYFGLRDYGNDGQIGLENTPELFVAEMVEVFTEVRRVLKNEGTLWLNLGDSYSGSGKGGQSEEKRSENWQPEYSNKGKRYGLKSKDLIGIPWMVAFALRSSGWYLRQDIIWHKPNPMPESVTDRCTKAHEYIFLMSKSQKYFYDADEIKTEQLESSRIRIGRGWNGDGDRGYPGGPQNHLKNYFGKTKEEIEGITHANKRSVWTVTTKPYSEAHFATFPEDLIVDCIKAGCPEGGIVLDPFMGAGTTAVVAKKLGRNYIGFELNPAYIEIANKRLYKEIGMFL